MKGLKLDFKKIGMVTAGNAAGLVAVHQVNQLKFLNNPAKPMKPVLKGLITLLLGRIGVPYIAGMTGLAGKKGGDFVEGVGQAMSTYGTAQILANTPATAKMVPAIAGYEDNIYGMGLIADDDQSVDGYEDAVYGPGDDTDDVYE
ncbi:MAG: hypothetical protein ABIQ31_18605 [Ferruginibacter sp.]